MLIMFSACDKTRIYIQSQILIFLFLFKISMHDFMLNYLECMACVLIYNNKDDTL